MQAPAAEWYRAGHVTLQLTDAARDFSAEWQFDRADNGDVRLVKTERRDGAQGPHDPEPARKGVGHREGVGKQSQQPFLEGGRWRRHGGGRQG